MTFRPINIVVIAEDRGHEAFLKALIGRLATDFNLPSNVVCVHPRSVRGGHGRVVSELNEFVQEIMGYRESLPDLLIVASDSNCVGYNARCKEMQCCVEHIKDRVVFAVPDPHIERWMLLDSSAFKTVFGTGCNPPDNKCDKDRYKSLLGEAFVQTDVVPILNGFEYCEDILRVMELDRINDESLKKLVQSLQTRFRMWKNQ